MSLSKIQFPDRRQPLHVRDKGAQSQGKREKVGQKEGGRQETGEEQGKEASQIPEQTRLSRGKTLIGKFENGDQVNLIFFPQRNQTSQQKEGATDKNSIIDLFLKTKKSYKRNWCEK